MFIEYWTYLISSNFTINSNVNLPKTYGLDKIAGTVSPTMNRNTSHDQKFQANVLSTHDTISNAR